MDDGVLQAMEAFGAPPEEIAATRDAMEAQQAAQAALTFGVYADNWRSVQAFLAVATQWDRAGLNGQRARLAYADVLAWVERFVHRRRQREVFADLQLMERAVLAYDRKNADSEE